MSKRIELRRWRPKKIKLYKERTRSVVGSHSSLTRSLAYSLTHYLLEAVERTGIEWRA